LTFGFTDSRKRHTNRLAGRTGTKFISCLLEIDRLLVALKHHLELILLRRSNLELQVLEGDDFGERLKENNVSM
jgi:hypothetical protein